MLSITVKNLIAALAVIGIVCFVALRWLDFYTQHGESVEIPDVRGITISEAEPLFARMSLSCQVIDSTFNSSLPAGSIIETIPSAGSKVKKGRRVFFRVNSIEAQLTPLPNVNDISQREARAMLRSMGFENLSVRLVPGQFRDLAIGLEINGREMKAGEKVPLNTPIVLLVSSGNGEADIEAVLNDTLVNPEYNEGENWY